MKITAENMEVTIGARQIVRSVSLQADEKQLVGIIGPNGSGKSTLLKAIYRVLKPSAGMVCLDGVEISSMPLRETARKMGVMAQMNEFQFDFTAEKMVLMGRTPHKGLMEPDSQEDLRLVEEAMEQTGTISLRNRKYSTLSGGEKQRVLIARTLAQQTPCIVLDEPTNHLDIKYQLQLMDIVRRLNRTVIAAVHDLNIAAAYCDYLYAMKDGELVGEGPPGELLTEAFIRNVYEVEAKVVLDDQGRRYIHYIPGA